MKYFIQIDEDGYFAFDGERVDDPVVGQQLYAGLSRTDNHQFITDYQGKTALVEAFNAPYVALGVKPVKGSQWEATLPYELAKKFDLKNLRLDEWDRFHGKCEDGIHFVMSRPAQAAFFDYLDSFTDTTITYAGETFTPEPWLLDNAEAGTQKFWDDLYKADEACWDIDQPAPPLVESLPQLKILKSRIAVLGCGHAHDAAFLAEQGHIVTAFDVSPEAIDRAEAKYGHLKNLNFVVSDILNLDSTYQNSFDICFEHTLYCALPPEQRNQIVQAWDKLLVSRGHLLGIFFVNPKRYGPPYGGSEWEVRERLKNNFQFLYWTRAKNSTEDRMGKELIVYAQKDK